MGPGAPADCSLWWFRVCGRGTDLGGRLQFWGVWTTVLGILPTRYSCSPTAHKMDTSTGGHSQQAGPNPAALVLARSGGMPRVGALRLAASSAPTRLVPQACDCCQTRGGAGPFGDRTRQSYSPGGRYGLEQHPGRGCCASKKEGSG